MANLKLVTPDGQSLEMTEDEYHSFLSDVIGADFKAFGRDYGNVYRVIEKDGGLKLELWCCSAFTGETSQHHFTIERLPCMSESTQGSTGPSLA